MHKFVIFQIAIFSLLLIFLLFLVFSGKSNLLPNTEVALENTTIIESFLPLG